MGGEEQGVSVCAACFHNCLLFHPTKPTSPTSFFKFITRQDYLTTLCIPPAFSSIVANMVNKKINLNDSSGQQWKVKVSEVNGSFVFGEGWSSFSLGLGLKVGYLLVFNYIKDLHFDVKIYDTSACEKLGFSKKRDQKKRSRGKIVSPVRDGILVRQEPNAPKMKRQCSEVDLDLPQNSKESGQLMHISDHCEDPCYSKRQEFDQSHGDDGTMKIENGDLNVSNVDYESNIFEKDAMTCSKDTMFEGKFSTEVALDISELEKSGRSVSLGEAETSTYGKTSNLKFEENKAILSNMEAQECQFSKGLGEMKKLPEDMTPNLDSSMDELNLTGEVSKQLKKELVTLVELEATGLPTEIKGLLDSDIFNEDNARHSKTTHLSCVVPHDNKLPKCLPMIRRVKVDQLRKMVVFLRDPLRRLWPVFYHEKPHLQLLAHGWLDFCRANNIQAKDECIFEAEVDPECKSKHILSVHIVHNK
ncbi:hypothetical protein PHAVU_009G169300 [Phaseolus vulgaris]|uniref:TF-B3 domain-containing protein n=2 Tax=Phaseolus vulgaris TaxID=3885 RepID=V7B0E5_PHAVU|nr:hypothetical protein PHAVU_009G169300g [Phaseolus vulgaris]ESW09951.1 hypothetical protein PHAVU_009G169300g [Phaseolus vulgaris]